MALGGVTFSALSRLQTDPIRFRSYFLKGYVLNVTLTLPITIFTAVFAQDIVRVVLGHKWADAAPIFQMLAPAVVFFGLVNPLSWLLFASHRHVRSLQQSLVIAVLVLTGCVLGLPYGPKGVAAGFSAAMILWLIPHIVWTLRGTPITPLDLARTSSRPLLAAILSAALAYAICVKSGPLHSPLAQLTRDGIVMMAAYTCLMILVMGKDFYLDLIKAMRKVPAVEEIEEVGNVDHARRMLP
jgi:PST family polysaccharide transporter